MCRWWWIAVFLPCISMECMSSMFAIPFLSLLFGFLLFILSLSHCSSLSLSVFLCLSRTHSFALYGHFYVTPIASESVSPRKQKNLSSDQLRQASNAHLKHTQRPTHRYKYKTNRQRKLLKSNGIIDVDAGGGRMNLGNFVAVQNQVTGVSWYRCLTCSVPRAQRISIACLCLSARVFECVCARTLFIS